MNILMINLDDSKEVFLTLPAIRGIKESHPKAKVYLLLNEKASPVLNFLSFVDQVITLPLSFFPDHFFFHLKLNEDEKKKEIFSPELKKPETSSLKVQRVSFYEKNFLYRLLYQDHFVDHWGYQGSEELIRFKSQMKEILNLSFDQLVNFSSHSLSGWLSFFIQSVNKSGLHYNTQGLASFGNAWLRYKNKKDHSNEKTKKNQTLFHPSDIYYYGAGVTKKKNKFYLESTSQGRLEAKNLLDGSFKKLKKFNLEGHSFFKPKFILFQPFSEKDHLKHEDLIFFKNLLKRTYKNLLLIGGDSSGSSNQNLGKNFTQNLNQFVNKDLDSIVPLRDHLSSRAVGHDFFFLLVDDNHSRSHYLKILEGLCLKEKIPISFETTNLESLLSLAEDSFLCFVKNGTDFQKMMSFVETQTIEFHWDGEVQSESSFKEGSFIIEVKRHTYGLPDLMATILSESVLTGSLQLLEKKLQRLGHRFESQIKIYKTLFDGLDFCIKFPLSLIGKRNSSLERRDDLGNGKSLEKFHFIQSCFERLSWKLYFEKEHLRGVSVFGSESLKVLDLLERLSEETLLEKRSEAGSLECLSKIEDQSLKLEDTFDKAMGTWLSLLRKKDETYLKAFLMDWKKIENFLKSLSSSDESNLNFSSSKEINLSLLQDNLNQGNLSFLRRIQAQLDDYSKKNQIQLKLVRSAKLHLKEKTLAHEKVES